MIESGQDVDIENNTNDSIGKAILCEGCDMWLNGPTQWEARVIGRKHKENRKKVLLMLGQTHAEEAPTSKPAQKKAREVDAQ